MVATAMQANQLPSTGHGNVQSILCIVNQACEVVPVGDALRACIWAGFRAERMQVFGGLGQIMLAGSWV